MNKNSNLNSTKTIYDANDFKIEFVVEKDHDKYMDFVKEHFLTREQLCCGLHLSPEDFMKYYREKSKSWMYSGLSTCATFIPTGEIAGLMLNQILPRDSPHAVLEDEMSPYAREVKYLFKIMGMIEESANIFDDPNIHKVWKIQVTTVAQKFAGNRIAYRLYEVSEKKAIEMGCQIATSQSTNIITQHIRKKLGFVEICSMDYESIEIDGKKVLDLSAMNGTTGVKAFKKVLVATN